MVKLFFLSRIRILIIIYTLLNHHFSTMTKMVKYTFFDIHGNISNFIIYFNFNRTFNFFFRIIKINSIKLRHTERINF